MKDRGKSVAVSTSRNCFSNNNNYYSCSSDLPCKRHPSSSSVGICAYCLKDRLIKLVCSDCGEQRLSSCSCSDISSSYPNSSTADIASVGRISFLIENDKEDIPHANTNFLKRSSSTSTHVNSKGASGRFWRFGRFFRKRRDKDCGLSVAGVDEKVDHLRNFDKMGVSRSRSIGGFREEKRRKSFIDFDGGFCEDDSGFIDIKFGFSSESKPDLSCLTSGDLLESGVPRIKFCRESETDHSVEEDGLFSNGSSCRISVDDKDIKKCRKSLKVWKWILKHQSSSSGRNSFKKDDTSIA